MACARCLTLTPKNPRLREREQPDSAAPGQSGGFVWQSPKSPIVGRRFLAVCWPSAGRRQASGGPTAERTASGRYLQPGLFAALSGGIGNP